MSSLNKRRNKTPIKFLDSNEEETPPWPSPPSHIPIKSVSFSPVDSTSDETPPWPSPRRSPAPPIIRNSPQKRRRCPNGTRRNKLGECISKDVIKNTRCPNGTKRNKSGECKNKRRRCPNGTRRNKSGECVKKTL